MVFIKFNAKSLITLKMFKNAIDYRYLIWYQLVMMTKPVRGLNGIIPGRSELGCGLRN